MGVGHMFGTASLLGKVLVVLIIAHCNRTVSATLDLPSFDFHGRDRLWAFAPGKVCVEDGLLPPVWMAPFAKVQLRIVPDVAGAAEVLHKTSPPIILQTAALGRGCKFLADVHDSCSSRGFLPEAISAILSEVQGRFCEDCSINACASDVWRDLSPVCRSDEPCAPGGVAAPRFISVLPTGSGCVHLMQMPKVPGVVSHRTLLAWEQHWDMAALARVVCGLVLIRCAQVLRESSALHALLGALAPLALAWGATVGNIETAKLPAVVVMAMNAVMQAPATVVAVVVAVASVCGHLLARGARASQASSMLNMLIGVLAPLFGALGRQASVSLDDMSQHDPDDQLPMGWIAVVSTLVSSVALWGWMLASPEDPVGEVSFIIGHDGRRIDALLATPLSQRCLGFALTCTGCVLLLRSTHCEALSTIIFLAAFFWNDVAHFLMVRVAVVSAATCEDFREPISQKAFEAQGQSCTATAMAGLQRYLRENPWVIRNVADDSVNQLQRFSHCGCDAK